MTSTTPFDDLEDYVALPRVSGLTLSPDGTRLVTACAVLDPKKTRYVTALWEVDPSGERPARRLTRSTKGESSAAFAADGTLLFVSGRPDPDAAPDDDAKPALWALPPGGGEARVVATRPGGVGGVATARRADVVVVNADTMPAAVTAEDDAARRTTRKDRKVAAILHEGYPVRYWDHDLGPDAPRLFAGTLGGDEPLELRDLTPTPGRSLDEAAFTLSEDGTTLVTTWAVPEAGGRREALAVVDVASGERRLLVDDEWWEFFAPAVSPDGTQVAVVAERRTSADSPPVIQVELVALADGARRVLTPGWDAWPSGLVWTPDGSALVVAADHQGRAPLFRVDVADGTITRLTGDHGAYSSPRVSPDSTTVYALRSAVDSAPAPVRLAASGADQEPVALAGPAPQPALPGTLTEVTATADDGTPLRAWLVLPEGASEGAPAPFLLWIHGGPLSSWNAWSWRWNPWLAAAKGYAVLLPDPALSTGYGHAMVERGWGRWGAAPYTDLMTLTDAAVARPDVDADRTAALGGSFGGYMANWVAGHTDRFRGIVTHASLWALDQFGPTTDASHYWRREMTAEMALANSPHRFVEKITTPMLVVHGDKDYRVPIGEGLRLWSDLAQHHAAPDGTMPHKFLYFPDENHWILSPQHAVVWYETVFAFLGWTVLDEAWQVPDVLR